MSQSDLLAKLLETHYGPQTSHAETPRRPEVMLKTA